MVGEGWNANGLSFFLEDQEANDDTDTITPSSCGIPKFPTDADTLAQAGLKRQPFSVQPMREECNQVIRYYLALHLPRELNLSYSDRVLVFQWLQHTTHPSAFEPALKVAEATLRGQSHQNFIRWSICNGNKPRIFFVRFLGVANLLAGFLFATTLTMSSASRCYRIFAFIPWFIGLATMVASCKGLCIILHHSHRRNLRPWERDGSDAQKSQPSLDRMTPSSSIVLDSRATKLSSKTSSYDDQDIDEKWGSRSATPTSMDTFGPKNAFEQELWVFEYERIPLLNKILRERCVWTQNETLRLLQDKIVLGSHLWGIIISVPLTAAFVTLPKGYLF